MSTPSQLRTANARTVTTPPAIVWSSQACPASLSVRKRPSWAPNSWLSDSFGFSVDM